MTGTSTGDDGADAVAREWTPLALAVAPTGARRTKTDHPALPIAPGEVAREARACLEAGACMIHLHVRDSNDGHTLEVDAYREAIAAVRQEVGDQMVIQATTEAVGQYTPEAQMATVRELRPEAVSLALRELIPGEAEVADAAEFLAWCRREAIAAQFILYDAADVRRFHALRERGVIPGGRPFLLYVLGRYTAGQRSEPKDLLPFLAAEGEAGVKADAAGDDPLWALCAFGPKETACACAAAALGGHVRVGFENNLFLPDGRRAPDNAALVAAVRDGAQAFGRPLADAAALRSWTVG